MVDLWKDTGERLKALAGSWAAYTALGSFILYLVGYLSLRFHVTALGLATDLAILDERYLFAGAKFLVYLVSAVPVVVLMGLVVSALVYAPYHVVRVMAARRSMTRGHAVKECREGMQVLWAVPSRLALTGIISSVAMIQYVMRECFHFTNLLVAETLPSKAPEWLRGLLLAEDEDLKYLYFTALLVGTAGTAGLLLWARSRPGQTNPSRWLSGLLAVLVAVQCLMLPVNYGILVADKTLPRVANLRDLGDLSQGQEAWLVWEGKEGIIYLVREAGKNVPVLDTVRRRDVKRIRIICYDQILRVLFARHNSCLSR